MKRYIYILIGIVVVAALAVVGLYLWKNASSHSVSSGTAAGNGSLPAAGDITSGTTGGSTNAGSTGAATGGGTSGSGINTLSLLSNDTVLNYFAGADGTVLAVEPNGYVEQIAGGQSTYLDSAGVSNILSASFSYDGKKVLVSSGSSASPQWKVFDVAKKTWTPLTISPIVASWSPSDYRIAYLAPTLSGISLKTLDIGNSKATAATIATFPDADFQISWPSSSEIILSDRPSAFYAGSVWSINPKNGAASTIIQQKVGLEVSWDASGTTGVVLVGNSTARGGQLGILDANGTLLHKLTFLTLPSKCAFDKATTTELMICGVPQDADPFARNPLPDAYEQKSLMTLDNLYTVDLATGAVNPLFASSANLDVSDAKFSNSNFYFINRYNQKLYSFPVPQFSDSPND